MKSKYCHGFYPEKELTLSMLEGKWKLTLLCHLGHIGTKRFSELQALTPEIGHQMLAAQLRELHHSGLVHREVYPTVPPKVEYSLTTWGKSLFPIMDMLYEWGRQHQALHPPLSDEGYTEKRLTLAMLEGKWKLVLLCHLGETGTQRFGELQRAIPTITKKMLTQQLREMAQTGLIHREMYPEIPPKVEYSLTAQGQSLLPILQALEQWGRDYLAQHPVEDAS